MKFARLTLPNGKPVLLAIDQIVEVRAAMKSERTLPDEDMSAVTMVNGNKQFVKETMDDILRVIECQS